MKPRRRVRQTLVQRAWDAASKSLVVRSGVARRLQALTTATFKTILWLSMVFGVDSAFAQNIVERVTSVFTANPVRLTDTDVSEFNLRGPRFSRLPKSPRFQSVAGKLEAHIEQFMTGHPWKPFHHTLGISGYEIEFDHPDELFLVLSLALPFIEPAAAQKTKTFLKAKLEVNPPYALEGFQHSSGRPRESYDVPPSLRSKGRGKAANALGVYSLWAYCHWADDQLAAREHWKAVQARMEPLLQHDYRFDVHEKTSAKGEAKKLNGDLAGLIGFARLAGLNRDDKAARQATERARELLELRVNLERLNPFLLEKSDAGSKRLHNGRLSRYCDLVPEVGAAVARHDADCGMRNLKAFRAARNGWFLAFGDRFIGGENYTNPLHFPRSVFTAAVFIEELPGEELVRYLDVPWCRGDLSFIEKCVYTLWSLEGRPWEDLQ